MRAIVFAALFLLAGTGAAFADCASAGGTVAADGVCEIPRWRYAQASPLDRLKAKAYARARGIRWRIVGR